MAVAPQYRQLDPLAAPAGEDLGRSFGKFALVGASGFAINLGVFAALEHAGLSHVSAAIGAFVVAAGSNFLWNRLWTFRARPGAARRQAPRFLAVAILGLLVNLAVLHVLVLLSVPDLVAQATGVVAAVPVTFLGSRVWSFPDDASSRVPAADGRLAVLYRLELRLVRIVEATSRYTWIVRWWALSRVLVLVPALVVQLAGWPRDSWYPPFVERPFALLEAWDGRWYRMVAERGYLVVPHHQSDTAFFPLYPLAMRAVHVFGLSLRTGGLLLANLGLLLALVALYELARTWVTEADARRTVTYAALFPIGFVFSMQYPEGLALAVLALAGLLAVRGRWVGAGLFAALAALARPECVFLALPFAALARRQWPELPERRRTAAVLGVLAAPASLAGLCIYEFRTTSDPLAFSHAQQAWGRFGSADGVVRAFHELIHASALDREWLYRDAIFCALYLGCLLLARRAGVPLAWLAAGALIVLLPLWSGSFTSDARFGLLALPVYPGLAYAARNRLVDIVLRVVSACLLVVFSATILLHWP
jgi:putative flippase GtrA